MQGFLKNKEFCLPACPVDLRLASFHHHQFFKINLMLIHIFCFSKESWLINSGTCVWILSLSIMLFSVIHVVKCSDFFFVLNDILLYGYIMIYLFTYWFNDGLLGCFQFGCALQKSSLHTWVSLNFSLLNTSHMVQKCTILIIGNTEYRGIWELSVLYSERLCKLF